MIYYTAANICQAQGKYHSVQYYNIEHIYGIIGMSSSHDIIRVDKFHLRHLFFGPPCMSVSMQVNARMMQILLCYVFSQIRT